ncbi:MAG TPA: tetratricopeptide repeat protein [Kofleriaceae bacterium]|nr:tetratricopeptide repeat protein [Kofleriaceae bacterium]
MRERLLIVVVLLAAAAGPAPAKSSGYADYTRVMRLIEQWRYDEARREVAALAQKLPGVVETVYLQAEMAYLDGDYARAVTLLAGLPDGALQGEVGDLRKLAAATARATEGFTSRDSAGGHFVIRYKPGPDEAIADLAGEVLEQARTEIGADLGALPPGKVRVEILGKPADLASTSTLTEKEIETTGTIALCKYNKLMVVSPRATVFGYPWMDTLAHEYTHFVVSTASADEVPIWLHEGLARFQQIRWRSGPRLSLTDLEEHLLAGALRARRLISFDDMHPSMAKLPSQEAATLAFAEVQTMVGFIHARVGYPGIRKVIALQRDGRSARRAVAEVLGMRWPEVEKTWKDWLRGAGLKSSRTLAGRAAGSRIRFDHGGKQDENVGVDEIASAKARRFARLGGLLRARGRSAAAAVEYEKALALAPDDPFVAGKLSRTYLELEHYERAIELAAKLAALDDTDAVAPTTLGLAYAATGRTDQAARAFEQALRISPFDPAVRCGLADAYGALGQAGPAAREQRACAMLK